MHTDQLGTPRKLTDASGAVVWDASLTPYGIEDSIAGTETLDGRFPGQSYDAESGLNYNYFRDYDPTLGRYLQSDIIGLAGGFNTYAYVGGNPVKYTDVYGLCPMCVPLIPLVPVAVEAFGYAASAVAVGLGLSIGLEAVLSAYNETGSSDASDEEPDPKDLTNNPEKIAGKTGLSVKEVKKRIHRAKRRLPQGTGTRNPDCKVDIKTGEIYPEAPGGGVGDSIGNIFD